MVGIIIRLFLFLLLLNSASAQNSNPCQAELHTLYSAGAISLDAASGMGIRLASPDHTKVLFVHRVEDQKDPDGMHINYLVKVGRKTFKTNLLGFTGEVAWAPDSKAFAITQTEGGGGIGSRVYVFFVHEKGISKLDVSRAIEKDFGSPVRCEVEVPPNTGFVAWKGSSSELLVAAEVVPVSVCNCAGTYRVYDIKLPGPTIVNVYSQAFAKKQFWDALGCELRTADDRCVKQLESHFTALEQRRTTKK